MGKGINNETLITILNKYVSESEHYNDGFLSQEREKVEAYYLGKYPKQQHTGDSSYVSRDVYDSVDTARATVLEAYSAHTRIVKFDPERGETVEQARQATDYTRHVYFKDNRGEDLMYEAFTEGVKKRFVVTKVHHVEESDPEEYEFDALTMEELEASLAEHDDFDIDEYEVDEEGLYSGTFTVPNVKKKLVVENIQPEDLMVVGCSPTIHENEAVIHRLSKTKSDLLKDGYEKDLVNKIKFGQSEDEWDYEKHKRFEEVSNGFHGARRNSLDPSGQTVTLYEIYTRLDLEGTGIQRLYKIVYAGDVILEKERISRMPFASFVPLPRPFTFFGENFAELVIPIQNARTVLIRQIINHSRVTNNPRLQVMNGTLNNAAELTDQRLGGLVNVRRLDGIAPLPQAPLNPFVFNLIGMINEDKEEVTGVSKLSQGLNKDAVSSQNSEGMVENLMNASQQRTKIIARRFGLYLKELFHLIYETAVDHIDEDVFIETLGSYVPVNPSAWEHRSTASVELTLSQGEQDREAQMWAEVDQYFTQDPTLSGQYTPVQRYEVISRMLEMRGVKDVPSVLIPPDQVEPQEPSEAEVLAMEEKKTQIAYQKAQEQAIMSKAKTDLIKAQADMIRAQAEAQSKGFQIRLDERALENDIFVDREELRLAQKAETQSATYSPNS